MLKPVFVSWWGIKPFTVGLWMSLAGLALLAGGCGDDKEERTPFGTVGQVTAWRQAVDPLIDQINALEAQVQREAVGSAGQATAENLAGVYQRLRPELAQVLVALDKIEPPPLLVPLHDDMRRLVVLRLDAYRAVMDGWELQQQEDQAGADALYRSAEAQLAAANALGAELNEGLLEVDVALGAAPEGNPLGQRMSSKAKGMV